MSPFASSGEVEGFFFLGGGVLLSIPCVSSSAKCVILATFQNCFSAVIKKLTVIALN